MSKVRKEEKCDAKFCRNMSDISYYNKKICMKCWDKWAKNKTPNELKKMLDIKITEPDPKYNISYNEADIKPDIVSEGFTKAKVKKFISPEARVLKIVCSKCKKAYGTNPPRTQKLIEKYGSFAEVEKQYICMSCRKSVDISKDNNIIETVEQGEVK